MDLWGFGFAVDLGHVRGRVADDSFHRSLGGMDCDALGFADDGVDTAKALYVDVAVIVDVVDGKGDLVGVTSEHDARPAALV